MSSHPPPRIQEGLRDVQALPREWFRREFIEWRLQLIKTGKCRGDGHNSSFHITCSFDSRPSVGLEQFCLRENVLALFLVPTRYEHAPTLWSSSF